MMMVLRCFRLMIPFLLGCHGFSSSPPATTPALSSLVPEQPCSTVPSEWLHPYTAPGLQEHVQKVLTEQHNASTLWGTYQPNRYFAVKSRTHPVTVASGILWHGSGSNVANARLECRQDHHLSKYGWLQHDGRRYGRQVRGVGPLPVHHERHGTPPHMPTRRQVIEDSVSRMTLETQYVRLQGGEGEKEWASRITVSDALGATEEDDEEEEGESAGPGGPGPSLYFYVGIDCDGAEGRGGDCLSLAGLEDGLQLEIDRSKGKAAVYIHGSTRELGPFTLEVNVYPTTDSKAKKDQKRKKLSVSYWGKQTALADLQDALSSDLARRQLGAGSEVAAGKKPKEALPDDVGFRPSVVVIKVTGYGGFVVDAVMHKSESLRDEEPGVEDIDSTRSVIDKAASEGLQGFKDRFEQTFDLKGKGYKGRKFSDQEIEAAQAALSNMVGGVGYFHGRTVIKGDDGRQTESFGTSLLTAVPSRSFFPRGFLWDEGFHHLLLHKWELSLTYDVVLHWLSHLHTNPSHDPALGWIPREIALGEQAKRRIPSEYLPQDVTVANPPTLLLVLEKVLDLEEQEGGKKKGGKPPQCSDEDGPGALARRKEFITAAQERVEKWMTWLLSSQRGPRPGSFRWRGRDPREKKLISNTLASGLDDYPRATEPSDEEMHVDLLCWMIKASQVMSRMARAVGEEDKARTYDQAGEEMKSVLESVHWDEGAGAYVDWGRNSEDGELVLAAPVRCGDRNTRSTIDVLVPLSILQGSPTGVGVCPESHSEVVGLISQEAQLTYQRGSISLGHVPRLGYVSLFPFLLGLLPDDSPRLGRILDLLQDPEGLWSPYGLRSLSKSDKFYHKENGPGDDPYWRGYIWININYLALRALHRLNTGPHASRAASLYSSLRDNLLSTLLSQYQETGYLWEQYHDATGRGLRSHPFTGWTGLVVNIMAEQY